MKKRPFTLFFMNSQTLRTERWWSLLFMQMHFLLVCLSPFGLIFYAFLFYSAGEPLMALLTGVMLFFVVLILYGMWRLRFWAYVALFVLITIDSLVACFQTPPLGLTAHDMFGGIMFGWIWAFISTCAAWRVRIAILQVCAPMEEGAVDTEQLSINSSHKDDEHINLPVETAKLFLFVLLSILFMGSTSLFIDKLNWYPQKSPIFFFAAVLFFIFMVMVYRSIKCAYKQILTSYKLDSPAKRTGAILSVLSFLCLLYRFIRWCDLEPM